MKIFCFIFIIRLHNLNDFTFFTPYKIFQTKRNLNIWGVHPPTIKKRWECAFHLKKYLKIKYFTSKLVSLGEGCTPKIKRKMGLALLYPAYFLFSFGATPPKKKFLAWFFKFIFKRWNKKWYTVVPWCYLAYRLKLFVN